MRNTWRMHYNCLEEQQTGKLKDCGFFNLYFLVNTGFLKQST